MDLPIEILAELIIGLELVGTVVMALVTAIVFLTKALLSSYKISRDDYKQFSEKQTDHTERVVSALVTSSNALNATANRLSDLGTAVSRCPHVRREEDIDDG
jgi:hypothetical protein